MPATALSLLRRAAAPLSRAFAPGGARTPAAPLRACRALVPHRAAANAGLRALSGGGGDGKEHASKGGGGGGVTARWPRPGHPYGWIEAEAEALIAKAYKRHKTLADTGLSMPPSLSVADLEKLNVPTHYPPQDLTDKIAYGFMRSMRVLVHAFFREKYDHHAVVLETVAGTLLPGFILRPAHSLLSSISDSSRNVYMVSSCAGCGRAL